MATTDVAPQSLAGLLGELPDTAADVPALSGDLGERWPLPGTEVVARNGVTAAGS